MWNSEKMKKFYLILLFILFSSAKLLIANSELKFSGTYQGENIYVMNPFAPSGVGFCIYEVRINGKLSTDEINSSAFEIDLSIYEMEIGDNVEVVIKHKDGCSPRILNPDVLKPKSTCKFEALNITKSGLMSWNTTGETGEIPFIVEQFKWSKWTKIYKEKGKGIPSVQSYKCQVNFHTGINKFRIKQIDYTNKPNYSQDITYQNIAAPITFLPGDGQKTSKWIVFSDATFYEIYDYYGRLQLKNKDTKEDKVDITSLEKGTYFINYDNTTETFIKK